MKKTWILVFLVAVLAAGYYAYTQRKTVKAPLTQTEEKKAEAPAQSESSKVEKTKEENSQEPVKTPPPAPQGVPTQGSFSDGSEAEGMAPDILVTEVVYDGKAFAPSEVNIKVGDIVIFKNNSQKSFWPASGSHPTHSAYPEFDPKQAVPPGGKFQFKFEKVGSWKYHDHLNELVGGVVNVAK